MGPHKVRMMLKKEVQNARKRFERQRRRNLLAEPGIHEMVIVLDHLKPSYNVGKIFRSAEAFGAGRVDLVGIDFFDPAPGMGSFKHVPAVFHDDFDACHAALTETGHTLVILEPERGESLFDCALPKKSAFVLGHEEFGISFDPDRYTNVMRVGIPQFGKVQSLNVSIAASIVMYEYVRQHGEGDL